LVERVNGTPQGGVVSPVLSNLFLHYVFDKWMERNFPNYPFARYADDGVVHCRSEAQARELKERLERRLRECKLELHPQKTQIVCCRVSKQYALGISKKFDFLGYCFRPRLVRNRWGKLFVNFTPAISSFSAKRIRQRVRRWRLHFRTSQSLDDLACRVNPIIRGWVNYYGAYQRSSLVPVLRHIDRSLVKWVKGKYKKKGQYTRRARRWLGQVARYHPQLFAHWRLGAPFPAE
jgi:RNA-directed DNA polymerase